MVVTDATEEGGEEVVSFSSIGGGSGGGVQLVVVVMKWGSCSGASSIGSDAYWDGGGNILMNGNHNNGNWVYMNGW